MKDSKKIPNFLKNIGVPFTYTFYKNQSINISIQSKNVVNFALCRLDNINLLKFTEYLKNLNVLYLNPNIKNLNALYFNSNIKNVLQIYINIKNNIVQYEQLYQTIIVNSYGDKIIIVDIPTYFLVSILKS